MPRTLSKPEFEAIKAKVLSAAPDGLKPEEFDRYIGPAMEQALGEAENVSGPLDGSAIGRFAEGAWKNLNPVAMVEGVYNAVRHPVDTATNIAKAQGAQFGKAAEDFKQGHYSEMAGHAAAGAIPVIGPAAAAAGERIASGDVAGGLGEAVGLTAPLLAVPAVKAAGRTVARIAPEAAADALDAAAAERYTNTMRPQVGANKQRFGNMASDVAPELAKTPEMAAWSREGLQAKVGEGLSQAEQALDAANDARLNARTFPTKPMIDALLEKRRQFEAQAVEGSRPTPAVTGAGGRPTAAGPVRDIQTGRMQTTPGKEARPIGEDVVPGPNAARVGMIDQAIAELRQLGPLTRYDEIRKIRQAYDGPAKAVYSPAVTADYMKAQGGKLGAADVTGALRDQLAVMDPATAAANSEYSLYKKASDVLAATEEVERTRPKMGRQIMTRLTSTLAGENAAGLPGAAAGFFLAPVLDAALNSGVTTKLQTAQLMTSLARAIRTGDMGASVATAAKLKQMVTRQAAVQAGSTTSPREAGVPAGQLLPIGAR